MLKKLLFTVTAALAFSAGATAALAADVSVGNGGNYENFDALMTAVTGGQQSLESGDTVTLVSDLTTTSTITVPSGYNLTLNMNGKKITSEGFVGRTFLIESGASVTVTGNGEMYSDSYGAFDVYGTLNVTNGNYTAKGYSDSGSGAILRTRPGSSLTVGDGVQVFSEAGGAVYAEGSAKLGKCKMVSHSHNGLKSPTGVNLYTYCVQLLGTGELNDTTVQGVQGALYAGGKVTINGGTYTAAELTDGSYTGKKAFYALYISNNAEVIINGGTFNAGSFDYCVQNSDNDVGMIPSDKITINNGVFNGIVGTRVNGITTMDGFTINGGRFSDFVNGSSMLSESALPENKKFVYADGYYSLSDITENDLGTAMPFKTTESEDTVGYYFDFERDNLSAVSKADVTLYSESKSEIKEYTIDIPTITTSGSVSFSLLVLNAPQDVTGTIELK